MKKSSEKTEKLKLNAAKFLKIIPERLKKIKDASSEEIKALRSYKPNLLAAELHPQIQHTTVAEIKKLTDDVTLYTLKADGGRLAPFGAGSYISVFAEHNGVSFSRPYSIASSPKASADGVYEIAVKRKDDGFFSKLIHDSFAVGTKVDVSAPAGDFTYEPLRDAKRVVCIAGGSGITPFRSMILSILDGTEDFELTLLYGAKRESEILFKDELTAAAEKDGRIKVVFVLSDEEKDGAEHGFIGAELIKKYAPEGVYSVFVCGPQAMYRYLEGELPKLGIAGKYIRKEVFGQISDPCGEPDYVKPEKEEFELTVRQGAGEKHIKCAYNETLLSAMERSGIAAPSRCRSGVCGFCHSKLVSGECYTPGRCDGRREADKLYSYIHPCSAFPLSDMIIDVPYKN